MNFVVKSDAASEDSPSIVLFATDCPGVAARVLCDDIRRIFGVPNASNKLLHQRARIRACNITALNDVANRLFQAGRYNRERGFQVIDIQRDDLIHKKGHFAWGKSDIPGAAEQDRSKVSASKFEQERYKVDSLLRFLGYRNFSISDPDPRHETGIDAVVELDDRKIGFQVTDFHSDGGTGAAHNGSDLRREERRKVAAGLPAALFVNPNPMPGLVHRIKDKSIKQWSRKDFPEVVLLISSFLPQAPGIGSTSLLDARLNVNEMNEQLSPRLEGTAYSAAYIYNMMQQSVYKWTRNTGWTRVPRYE